MLVQVDLQSALKNLCSTRMEKWQWKEKKLLISEKYYVIDSRFYNIQMGILIISTLVLGLFPYTDKKDEMTRSNGITYLMLYGLYMVLLFTM